MTREELMIGDWVLKDMNFLEDDPMYTRTDYQPYQIMTGEDIDLACETNWLGDDVYQPIPLTPEILEKNGFGYIEKEETCATEAFHQWRLENSWFALDDDSWWRSIKDSKLHIKFGGFPLEYVHQLQHALRLCNISKEIEL